MNIASPIKSTHTLFQEFGKADDAFQCELVRLYGNNAGDRRYCPDDTYPPKLRTLCESFKAASEAWRVSLAYS